MNRREQIQAAHLNRQGTKLADKLAAVGIADVQSLTGASLKQEARDAMAARGVIDALHDDGVETFSIHPDKVLIASTGNGKHEHFIPRS